MCYRLSFLSQFGCDACDMKFNTKKKLLSHHNVEHATDAQFVCQKCGKRCGSASQLKLHARRVGLLVQLLSSVIMVDTG